MRSISLILSFITFIAMAGGAQAGLLSAPGPNPNWTKMQQFEWYLGYMSRAANMCGSFQEAGILDRLARMTPYGNIGQGAVMGDGFSGTACVDINASAKELAADAKKIEEYIEATYNCTDEACFGQKFVEWKSHACADDLMVQLSKRDVTESDLREVTISDLVSGASRQITARIRLKSCEGSLYVEMSTSSCRVLKEYTRGDCAVAGVDGY